MPGESPLIVPGGRPEEKDVPEVIEADTAVLLWRTPDGQTGLSQDINIPIKVRRTASPDDIHGLCANVMKDVAALEAADTIIAKMSVIQRQAMQQAQAQQTWEAAQAAEADLQRKMSQR